MDLWIRSQDRERLGKIVYLELKNDDYGFHIMGWRDKFEGTRIATYKTKERALEVLDEINEIKYYKYMASLDWSAFARSILMPKPEKEQQLLLAMMNTYQMPSE